MEDDAATLLDPNQAPTTALLNDILALASRVEIIEASPDATDRRDAAEAACC